MLARSSCDLSPSISFCWSPAHPLSLDAEQQQHKAPSADLTIASDASMISLIYQQSSVLITISGLLTFLSPSAISPFICAIIASFCLSCLLNSSTSTGPLRRPSEVLISESTGPAGGGLQPMARQVGVELRSVGCAAPVVALCVLIDVRACGSSNCQVTDSTQSDGPQSAEWL